MAELTLEQKRAIAVASARLRLQEQSKNEEPVAPTEEGLLHKAGRLAIRGLPAGPLGVIGSFGAEAMAEGSENLDRLAGAAGQGTMDLVRGASGKRSPMNPLGLTIPDEVAAGAGTAAHVGVAALPMALGTTAGAGLITPVVSGARRALQAGRNIVDPMLPGGAQRSASRLLSEAAGAKRPAIEAELAANRVLVPGSQPTAAEAAAGAGSAEFSGLQRVAEQRMPTVYSDIAKGQEAARRGAIGGIAKDDAAVKVADTARGSEAGRLYGEARKQTVKADAVLNTLLKRPSMDKALARAAELAEESGEKFILKAGQPAQQVPSKILGPSGSPAAVARIPEKFAEYPVSSLHHIKTALDDMVKNPERFGIGATEARAIDNTRRLFVTWLEKKVPAYETARTAYAKASRPINQMQVGQELEKALVKPIGEGERAGVFAGAVREAPRTIKRATGQPRFDELEQVLDAGDYQTVKNVLADLSRKAEHDKLARLGQSKASEITSAFSLPATGPLHQQYMVFKTVLGRVSRGVNEKTLDEISKALQLPHETLKLLRLAPPAQRGAVIDGIIGRKLGIGVTGVAALAAAEGQHDR